MSAVRETAPVESNQTKLLIRSSNGVWRNPSYRMPFGTPNGNQGPKARFFYEGVGGSGVRRGFAN